MGFIEGNLGYILIMLSVILGFGALIFKAGKWVGSTDGKISRLQASVDSIEKRIKTIQEDIKKLFRNYPSEKTADASSPLHLNDLGKKVSDHVQADVWVVENFKSLVNEHNRERGI